MALLQVEAAVSCRGDAVVADFGLGPDWEGAEMEAVSRPSTTTTRRLPPPSGEPRRPEPRGGGGRGVATGRGTDGAERCQGNEGRCTPEEAVDKHEVTRSRRCQALGGAGHK